MILCRERVPGEEWLDESALSHSAVAANLRDIALVNRTLGGAEAVLSHLDPAIRAVPVDRPVDVLDIACGGGDILRAIARRVERRGRCSRGVGLDRSPGVLAHAREHPMRSAALRWVLADVADLPFLTRSFDVVICSCFLHHLSLEQSIGLVRAAAALTRDMLIISDLVRSSAAYVAFGVWSRLLGLHQVTKHDGAVSLRRAYRHSELAEIARGAGLREWRIYHHRYCRMTLVSRQQAA